MKRLLLAIIALLAVVRADARSVVSNAGQGSGFVPVSPAYYVSPTGSDSNSGTFASPFLTITKAQTAMQGGSTKFTYIRAGIYNLAGSACGTNTCGINFTTSDNNTTYSYYPPDGVNSAIFSGQFFFTTSTTGLWIVFHDSGATNLTINGLTIEFFNYAGISSNGSTGMVVENNIIHDGYYVPGSSSSPGGFTAYSAKNLTTSHNVVYNIAGFGINNTEAGQAISNWTAAYNVIYNTCTSVQDCGGLYGQDLNQTSTGLAWTNNYIRDTGTFAGQSSSLGEALYFDDCLSNLAATANILTGNNGSNTVFYHAGNSLTVTGNIVDFSSFAAPAAVVENSSGGACGSTISGDTFNHNILVSLGASGQGGYNEGGITSGTLGVTANSYWNYGGSAISHTGSYTDSNPTTQDPQMTGYTYTIASGSPVYNTPVSFPGVSTGWGPPGYVIPQSMTGTLGTTNFTPPSNQVQAIRLANVIGILGVNTHIPFNNYGYQTYSQVESNLTYLGFPIMRDSAEASADVTNITTVANAAGVKVDDFVGETSQSQMAIDAGLQLTYSAGVLMAIEGGNEEDDSYAAGLGNTLAATATLQEGTMWPNGKTLGLPVINMSFGTGYTSTNGYIGDYFMVGDLSDYTTWANAHTYPQTGQNPQYAMGFVNTLAHMAAGQRQVATTEIGWPTGTFTTTQIEDYALEAVMDAQLFQNTALYFYALYDDGSGNWGLFNADGTTRPVSVALHNLTTILADTGGTAKTFTPGFKRFTQGTVPAPSGAETNLLMQDLSGNYWYAIWNETESSTYSQTVHFGSTATGGGVYDPTSGTTPTSTFGAVSSVTVTVEPYPIFIKVSGI